RVEKTTPIKPMPRQIPSRQMSDERKGRSSKRANQSASPTASVSRMARAGRVLKKGEGQRITRSPFWSQSIADAPYRLDSFPQWSQLFTQAQNSIIDRTVAPNIGFS